MHQDYINSFTDKARNDSAIRAAWLEGSFGRGEADRYADIDIHLLLDPTQADAFKADAEGWLNTLRPLVLFREMFNGAMITSMTVDGLRVDLVFHADDEIALGGKPYQLLFDKGDYVDRTTPKQEPHDDSQQSQIFQHHIEEFWRIVAILPSPLGRDELAVGFMGLTMALLPLTEVLIDFSGTQRASGIKRLNQYLLPELRNSLKEALHMEGLTPEGLARAHLRLARLMQRCGPEIAVRHGFAYRHALEETAIRYITQELRHLGLEQCLEELD